MPTMQIRNVPENMHRALKSRAALAGMSLSEFALKPLERSALRPTVAELRARLASRKPVQPSVPPARILAEERARSWRSLPLTWPVCDGMFDGMKTMTHRTTFALDEDTAGRLRRLSAAWQVSQAEVVRRALAMAEESGARSQDAASLLEKLHESGQGLAREAAQEYLAAVREDRRRWRRRS